MQDSKEVLARSQFVQSLAVQASIQKLKNFQEENSSELSTKGIWCSLQIANAPVSELQLHLILASLVQV